MSLLHEGKLTRRKLLGLTGVGAGLAALVTACADPVTSSTPDVVSSPIATPRNPNISPSRAPQTPNTEAFITFHSMNYNYQVDYPSSWSAVSSNKIDIIQGPQHNGAPIRLSIGSDPIPSYITYDDYLKQVFDAYQIATGGKEDYSKFVEIQKSFPDSKKPVIDGKRVPTIYLYQPDPQNHQEVRFLAKSRVWTFTITGNGLVSTVDKPIEALHIIFDRIIPSFKPIQ